eukprot:1068616-Pelagomonas_calceolata.AAC.1
MLGQCNTGSLWSSGSQCPGMLGQCNTGLPDLVVHGQRVMHIWVWAASSWLLVHGLNSCT